MERSSFRTILQDSLWDEVVEQFPLGQDSCHGSRHWLRVLKNGLYLCEFLDVSRSVVEYFALFHDSRRLNDEEDAGHGARGADLARLYHKRDRLNLNDREATLLFTACEIHTDVIHVDDPTLAVCLDADRLDLPRVGIIPDPRRMNTAKAKEMAGSDWRPE